MRTVKPLDARFLLCVPADAPRFFTKAADRGADVVGNLGGIRMHNVFPRLSRTPGRIRKLGPALGEHQHLVDTSAPLTKSTDKTTT